MDLAIDGGSPLAAAPFAPWPYFAQDEIEAAQKPLLSGKVNYWTGTEGREFEKEYAAYAGCRYGVAVSSGTVALELALYALGITPEDEVITTSRTFIASASCIVLRGATPVIADVDPISQNITADTIRHCITPRTKAIICVHLAGWPCDMDPILELARERNLKIIEDCAQCHGAVYKGRPVGSLGDVAAFSFCQDKIITTGGEGGMITTNDEDIWRRTWEFKDHGKSWEAVYRRQHAAGFRWLHESFGTNARLTEIQSAIGRVQLRKLPGWLETRRRFAAILSHNFSQLPALLVTQPPPEIGHAYYKYYVFLRPELLKPDWSRDRVAASIVAEGIPCSTGSCSEIYLERAFREGGIHTSGRLPVARRLGETSLCLLVHPTLSEESIRDTWRAMEKVMAVASLKVA